jgi:hypothetical protein
MNAKKPTLWTGVSYPQDFSNQGATIGPQTILRLRRLIRAHSQENFIIKDIVFACGIRPHAHEYPLQKDTFSEMMKEWILTQGNWFSPESIHCSPNIQAWNCIESTLEMIHIINTRNLSRNVLVVSTGFHIYPRMWVTWKILCPKSDGWNLHFVSAWEGSYGIFHELAGTAKYIPMALWYRLRQSNRNK